MKASVPSKMCTLSLWSFLRDVLAQGATIQMDYTGRGYEAFSARLDAAAIEREKELEAALRPPDLQTDRADAEKWRALIGCARVRMMGCAGLHPDTQMAPRHAHIGMEFWTHHNAGTDPHSIELFEKFVAMAAAAQRGAHETPG